MKITETAEGTKIEFGTVLSPRQRSLLYFKGGSVLIVCLFFVSGAITLFSETHDSLISTVVMIAVGIIFYIAFKRYMVRVTNKESLLITATNLVITNRSLYGKKTKQYETAGISRLMYIGSQPMTDHPLKFESFDALGFQTEQHVIKAVAEEGNMRFIYNDKPVYFGIGIFSWDAEKIAQLFSKYTHLQMGGLPEDFSIEDAEE